jgi:cob(I)alamin adenosyltransferase
MPIYTKKGDKGETSIFRRKMGKSVRVSKADLLIEAIGSIDEANSYLGIIASISNKVTSTKILKAKIEEIQKDLFTIGSMLAGAKLKIVSGRVEGLEKEIDEMDSKLPKLNNFILPGGSEVSAHLMFTRVVVRRAERRVVALAKKMTINHQLLKYLNRLSDYLFVLARWVNLQSKVKETKWIQN